MLVAMAALAGLLCSYSCRSRPSSDSEVFHDAGTPTFGFEGFHWAPITYNEFSIGETRPPFRVGPPIPDSAPVAKRLQDWADKIHALVVTDFKAKYPGKTPPPAAVMKVVPSKSPNAWAAGVPVCVEGSVKIKTPPGTPARQAKRILLNANKMDEPVSLFGQPPPACIRAPSTWPTTANEFVKWFNTLAGPTAGCQLSLEGNQYVVDSATCVQSNSKLATGATQLSVLIPANYIHFTSAYLAMMVDERTAIRVVAHELGHYYRGHVTSELVGQKYNYWYQQTKPPKPGKPEPIVDSQEIEKTFARVLPYPRPTVPGQKLSMELTQFVIDYLGGEALPAACTTDCACKTALTKRTAAMVAAFACIACTRIATAQQDEYLKFEKDLLACAVSIQVKGTAPAKNQIAHSEFKKKIEQDKRLSSLVGTVPPADTLANVLKAMNKAVKKVDAERAKFHQSLKTRFLGRYTAEQEADDFATEYLPRIGIDPLSTIELDLNLYEQRFANDPLGFEENSGLSLARCREIMNGGWNEFVPIGNLFDSHQGACYRAFNVAQEFKAHGYQIAQAPIMIPWTPIQAESKKITDDFFEPPALPVPPGSRQGTPTQGLIVDGLR